jgi:hypothetical protein
MLCLWLTILLSLIIPCIPMKFTWEHMEGPHHHHGGNQHMNMIFCTLCVSRPFISKNKNKNNNNSETTKNMGERQASLPYPQDCIVTPIQLFYSCHVNKWVLFVSEEMLGWQQKALWCSHIFLHICNTLTHMQYFHPNLLISSKIWKF